MRSRSRASSSSSASRPRTSCSPPSRRPRNSNARAREDCAELRAQAEADAQTLRANADDDARRAREEANAEAAQTIEEGLDRRGQIDHQIHELEDHRAAVLEDLGRLRAELSATIHAHSPTPAKQNGEPDHTARDAEADQQS